MQSKVTILTFPTLEMARERATNAQAEEMGSLMFPAQLFKQASRPLVSGVLSMAYISRFLRSNPAEKEKSATEVGESTNRPLNIEHAFAIRDYLYKNYKESYIIPPLTLNVDDPITIYTLDTSTSGNTTPCYVVMPFHAGFQIIDGQHRKKGIELFMDMLSNEEQKHFKNDGIPVMITLESDIKQIHQDFADCSKTKEISKSLVAIFDRRNPANALVNDLLRECLIFHDADGTSNTLSKKSTKLWLVSQIRSFVKELMMGSSATADAQLEKEAYKRYETTNSHRYTEDIARFTEFTNKITQQIEILNRVSKFDKKQSAAIPDLRAEYLILNSAGLNIVGRIGRDIITDPIKFKHMDSYISALANIDWRKNADIWQGNIVQRNPKGKLVIATANRTISQAVQIVKEEIGLIEKQTTLM